MKSGQANSINFIGVDIIKCYDEMGFSETQNDIYDAGINSRKFALLNKLDEECLIKIKTPVGMTSEFKLFNLILQGSVLGPIKCSVQQDSLGREVLSEVSENYSPYKYRDMIDIPPLSMMDDTLSVSECGRNNHDKCNNKCKNGHKEAPPQ